ncbi:MAG: branched-chain amino acid ABC transporter permease [Chlamydiae bacterium]|nr:branched-chain amino acid ABC transporter permease [Chlamydiota bacterium]MBI3267363.1 branched-chain amino acid ABC transporter permease [Chlamydiota bacterium]
MKSIRQVLFCVAILCFFFFLNHFLTLYLNPYYLQILIYAGINVILAISLNLVNAQTGQFSMGHAGFMAVGAYASAFFTDRVGPLLHSFFTHVLAFPDFFSSFFIFGFALVIAGCLSAGAGFIVGLPVLRLRGDYLAIATLGFGEIIRVMILNMDVVGGARGFTDIPIYTNVFWLGLCVYGTWMVIGNLIHSTKGRAFLAIREDEVAAECMGIHTTKYKVGAFVIGAFFAGVGGALLAHEVGYLHTNSFTFLRSIEIVVMVVLGGTSLVGSALAAIVLTLLPEVLRFFSEYRMVVYSLVLIFLMLARAKKWKST